MVLAGEEKGVEGEGKERGSPDGSHRAEDVAGVRLSLRGDEEGGCRRCIQDRTSTTGDVRGTCKLTSLPKKEKTTAAL